MVLLSFNDTHMEELGALLSSVKKSLKCWVGCFGRFSCLHNQLSPFNSIIVQVSEKRDSQTDSQNEWLLLSVPFTAKLELLFVLTFENLFS